MSHFELSPVPQLDAAIDRLVANELDASGRRELLVGLDATADGWRRCALAFLEDQAWRAALARPADEIVLPSTIITRHRPKPSFTIRKGLRFAAAAGLLAMATRLSFLAGAASVENLGGPEVASAPKKVGERPDPSSRPGQPLGWASLVDPAEGEALPRQVPILEATASNERWLQEQPATIPDYVRAQWQRRGYQVEEHRRLVGVDLKDGRHVGIPVDEVAVDFVGRQPL